MPRIAITDNLLEERRVAKQRLNARRSRGNVLSSSSLTSAGQAAPLPVRRKGEAANNTILDIGPQDQACRFCGALVWAAEFTGKHVGMSPKAYSIYCTKGKVQLPLLKETPPELKQLLTGTATREIKFQHNLRMYNIIFALCSFGGSVDESINNGSGPYVFRVNDHVYHSIGSLVPPDGRTPKFAQFYMYDGQEAVDYCLQFLHTGEPLDPDIAFRLQCRAAEGHTLLLGGRLFLQYVVDAWCCIERGILKWVEKHQSIIRSDLYKNIVDSVRHGDVSATEVGKRIVLPSSFTGGFRYMQQNFQDSLAICKEYGHSDLFVTFTCNPKWVEIQRALAVVGSTDAAVRPDLVARVFKLKRDTMMCDFMKKDVVGRVLAAVYTIEFQKRGLPHAHIVLWMAEGDKLVSTEDIDHIISAELPDKETDPIGYEAVSQLMMHGPCGEAILDVRAW